MICSRLRVYSAGNGFEHPEHVRERGGGGGEGFRKFNTSDECGRRDATVRPANHQFPVVGGGESEF